MRYVSEDVPHEEETRNPHREGSRATENTSAPTVPGLHSVLWRTTALTRRKYSFTVACKYGHYCVYLPHSCDEWTITEGKDKEKVLRDLDDFIAQAQEAREHLLRDEDYGT